MLFFLLRIQSRKIYHLELNPDGFYKRWSCVKIFFWKCDVVIFIICQKRKIFCQIVNLSYLEKKISKFYLKFRNPYFWNLQYFVILFFYWENLLIIRYRIFYFNCDGGKFFYPIPSYSYQKHKFFFLVNIFNR